MQERKRMIAELNRIHGPRMAQLAYRRLGSRALAEDLVQEVFLLAWIKQETVCSHRNPAGWLFLTLSYKMEREEKKLEHKELPLHEEQLTGTAGIELPLEHCLPAGLGQDEREILLLRLEKQYGYAEIAERTGMTETASRQRFSRAMQRCQRLLAVEMPLGA